MLNIISSFEKVNNENFPKLECIVDKEYCKEGNDWYLCLVIDTTNRSNKNTFYIKKLKPVIYNNYDGEILNWIDENRNLYDNGKAQYMCQDVVIAFKKDYDEETFNELLNSIWE